MGAGSAPSFDVALGQPAYCTVVVGVTGAAEVPVAAGGVPPHAESTRRQPATAIDHLLAPGLPCPGRLDSATIGIVVAFAQVVEPHG